MNRAENMRRIKSRDTKPEMTIRSLVYELGYRYRLYRDDLPGKPDLAFASRRKVIFVHGCFWHSHNCKLSHVPQSNTSYWMPKLGRTIVRDKDNIAALKSQGWKSIVIWECELAQPKKVARRITRFLGQAGASR